MKLSKFNEIIAEIGDSYESKCIQKLCSKFPDENKNTLQTIFCQQVQYKVRKNHHRIMEAGSIKKYYEWYCKATNDAEAPGILLRIAESIPYSPAMLAKAILEHYLEDFQNTEEETAVFKYRVNRLLRDTNLIPDRDLSYEVFLCILEDEVYGPYSDNIKHSIGHEYEFHLEEQLKSLDVSYFNEDVMRIKGYDKTPDIRLDLPIAIDGHVINWIESKALFGDPENHKNYLRDQFWSYWNRFGPGLVIYWLGFVDDLDQLTDKGILIKDHFPANIVKMDPSLSTTSCDGTTKVS